MAIIDGIQQHNLRVENGRSNDTKITVNGDKIKFELTDYNQNGDSNKYEHFEVKEDDFKAEYKRLNAMVSDFEKFCSQHSINYE
jgi:hypothetical protein